MREVTLTLTSPEYGAFLQEGPVVVSGRVSDASAIVLVDGQPVTVAHDGSFETSLAFTGDYEVVDVRVSGDHVLSVRERVPVFSGNPPMDSFPEAMPARFTNDGLARLGVALGAQIDATNWEDQLLASLPSIDTAQVKMIPTAVTHSPTVVVLQGVEDGLLVGIELRDVVIHTDVTFEIFGSATTLPLTIGYETINIGAMTTPTIREDGVLVLLADETSVDFADPVFKLDGNDIVGLPFLIDAANALVEPAAEWLSDQFLGFLGETELGGPFDFETDAMGTSLAISMKEVAGDPEGLTMGFTVGVDAPAPEGPLTVPYPSPSERVTEPVHLVAGVHEGLLDTLVGGAVGDQLGSGLDLGSYAVILGNLVTQFPGGEYAPPSPTWCVDLAPGPAQVVRLKDGIEPMGVLYLPDVDLTFGTENAGVCETWLAANVALEINLVADGSKIGIDLALGEGAVMAYAAPREAWTEDEVVAAIEGLLNNLGGILGSQLSFDLAEMLGDGGGEGLLGALGPLEPQIVDSQPMLDAEGQPIEGLFALSLSLWAPEE